MFLGFIFTGFILIVVGLLVKLNPNLLAGYNTMPEEKKKEIDIEKVRNKIVKVSDKFIDYEYSFLGNLNNEVERLTLIWCIKECIYKISNEKLPFIFKNNCIVTPFNLQDSSVISWLKFNRIILSFKSYLHSFEDYKLVYLIQNK